MTPSKLCTWKRFHPVKMLNNSEKKHRKKHYNDNNTIKQKTGVETWATYSPIA